jgi:hypothetical protein
MSTIRNVRSHDAPVSTWRWARDPRRTRDERPYVGFNADTPRDGAHLVPIDPGKMISLGATLGGRGDAQLEYDGVVDAVAAFASGFLPDVVLHSSQLSDVMSSGARWIGELTGPVAMALANRAPPLNANAVVRDAVKKLWADARHKSPDELQNPREKADAEAAEKEEARMRAEGRDGPRGRMSSGHRFTGGTNDAGFGARFIDQAREQTRSTIARMQAANRKYREERRGVTLDAPRPSTSVAAPPKTGSMASWIGRINTANREYTQRKREQERRALDGGGRGR